MEKARPQSSVSASDLTLKPIVAPIPEYPKSAFAVPKVLDQLLNNAAVNKASEILIEHQGSRINVRQRIRGVLIGDLKVPVSVADVNILTDFVRKAGEVKTENGLKWAEARLDCAFNEDNFICRLISSESQQGFTLITIHLSKIIEKPFDPSAWGMGPNQAQVLESFLSRQHGLLLFCGSNSDDLTSNIHACTKSLATSERHVIAIESQVQPWFFGVEQLVSNGNADVFSSLMRLAFRHEPDLVVVNPLDTKEHVDLCLSEALKGRLVLARVYASNVSDALMQLMGMGIEPYLVGSAVIGIVAQRSLRLNCQNCQDKDQISRDRLKEVGIPVGMQPTAFFHGKGCDTCYRTGFDRETNIFEVLEMSDELRVRLTPDIKSETLNSIIKSSGMMTLRQVALHKAINGQTSLSEVIRVT